MDAVSRSGSAQWVRQVLRRGRREWLVDTGLTLGGFALGILLLLATMSDDPDVGDHVPLQVFGGVVASVAFLVFRRSYPALLALVCAPFGFAFVTASGTAIAAFFTVAAFRRARIALLVTGFHAVLVLVLFRTATESWATYWQAAGTFLFLDIVALTSGMLARSHHMLVNSLEERARQAEKEQRLRVDEARHLERERIAREMHDVLAHRISLLAVHAGALEFRAGASAEETRAAGVIRQSAHDALEDLRDVIRMLRRSDAGDGAAATDSDRPQPTLADLPALIEQSRRAGAVVDFDFTPDGERDAERSVAHDTRQHAIGPRAAGGLGPGLDADGGSAPDPHTGPPERQLTGDAEERLTAVLDADSLDREAASSADGSALTSTHVGDSPENPGIPAEARARMGRHAYRIVQEGLTNARKHAPGEPVRVRVDTAGPSGLRIEIANPLHSSPAPPGNPIPGSGTGLIGLRERVTLVGGRLEHGADGGEFRLWAWLPWTP